MEIFFVESIFLLNDWEGSASEETFKDWAYELSYSCFDYVSSIVFLFHRHAIIFFGAIERASIGDGEEKEG